jgi:hypothetical protein
MNNPIAALRPGRCNTHEKLSGEKQILEDELDMNVRTVLQSQETWMVFISFHPYPPMK